MLPQRSFSEMSRPFRWVAFAFAGLVLVYTLLTFGFTGKVSWYTDAAETLSLLINLGATLALAYAAIRSRRLGRQVAMAWGLLAAAQALYLLGDLTLFILSRMQGEVPYLSLADAFYLLYYPLFIAGLLMLPTAPLDRYARLKVTFDLGIVALSAALLSWNFIFAPVLAEHGNGSLAELFISVVYPAFDLVLFLVLLRLLFRQSKQFAPTLLLLEASIAFLILGDVLYDLENLSGSYSGGNYLDLFFVIFYALVGTAGAWQAHEQYRIAMQAKTVPLSAVEAERNLRWLVYLPYIWSAFAYTLLIFHEQVSNIPFSILAAGIGLIFFLVMLRQFVSFQENATLFDQEQRRRRLAEGLSQAARTLSTTLDFQAVPPMILDQLALVVPYERCSIMLRQDRNLYIAAQRGFPEDKRTSELRIEITPDDIYLRLEATRQPVVLLDVTQVPGWRIVPWLALNKSWMGVPLESGSDVIGMISLTRQEANAFSNEDASQALAFAGQAAVALENARLYQELSQAYHIVETMDRTKSRFIEIVAHELRTPLTVIKGYSQTLGGLPAVKGDVVVQSVLDGIQRGTERMYEVVNNMLDITKIENEVLQLHKEEIKIQDLFARIASYFQKGLLERKLALELEALDDLPLIKADPNLMHKVFLQLVMNAIKYTPDGGKITVTGILDLSAREVEITIKDTGIGIDPTQIGLIFEKFYQTGQVELHSSSQIQFKGGGPGLGLPIARGIVVAHGGKIWATSPGLDEANCPGSQFHVRLPA